MTSAPNDSTCHLPITVDTDCSLSNSGKYTHTHTYSTYIHTHTHTHTLHTHTHTHTYSTYIHKQTHTVHTHIYTHLLMMQAHTWNSCIGTDAVVLVREKSEMVLADHISQALGLTAVPSVTSVTLLLSLQWPLWPYCCTLSDLCELRRSVCVCSVVL